MASLFQEKDLAKNYKALIFDLDDTLLAFSPGEENSLNKLHEYFFPSHPLDLYKKMYHEINKNLWDLVNKEKMQPVQVKIERFKRLASALNTSLSAEILSQFYENALGKEVHWIEGAKETLTHLKKTHKLAVITNGLTAVQESKRHLSGLEDLCDSFIISEKVGISKPNKAIFDICLTSLGIANKEALMVGDSLTSDYQGALNAGIDFCWVNPHYVPLPADLPHPQFIVNSIVEFNHLYSHFLSGNH